MAKNCIDTSSAMILYRAKFTARWAWPRLIDQHANLIVRNFSLRLTDQIFAFVVSQNEVCLRCKLGTGLSF